MIIYQLLLKEYKTMWIISHVTNRNKHGLILHSSDEFLLPGECKWIILRQFSDSWPSPEWVIWEQLVFLFYLHQTYVYMTHTLIYTHSVVITEGRLIDPLHNLCLLAQAQHTLIHIITHTLSHTECSYRLCL